MTFVLSPGRDKIFAEGWFELDTPKLFDEFVRQNGLEISITPVTVVFNSPGGKLVWRGIGTKIRDFGFNTAVGLPIGGSVAVAPGLCASACAIAFLGGKQRSLGPKDRLGIHQFWSVSDGTVGRGKQRILAGDIIGAREVLGRAAAADNAEALLILGETSSHIR
jgi:hypothetical protein